GFDDVLVVVGYEHEAVIEGLKDIPVRVILNTDYLSGMGSSFRTAVGTLEDATAAMFALADQPLLTAADYRRLLEAWRASPRGIVSVRYGDVTAPPHLFGREYFPELAALEHGARPVLRRHAQDTRVLQFDPALLLDVDTPEDYERARQLLGERGNGV